VKFSC